jgi:RNA polymerase sigma-70 factor, ECF subfamily
VKISLNGREPGGHDAVVTALPMTMPIAAVEATADDELVVALRAGDRDAVEQAYVAHHAAIRGFARRLVGDEAAAEDIVHEAFVALPRAIRRFRGESSLRSFLIGVAINHSRRHVRSSMRRRRATERLAVHDEVLPPPAAATPADVLRRKRLADRLWSALDRLPIDQRAVFVLCEAEQRTSVEVAEIVGAPEGTVRTRLFHAKRKLREILEDERDG